jgi:hypothetical protein
MSECPKCGSPHHGEKACPQAAGRGKKSTFHTRKQMGLRPGELPFKFRTDIDPEHDGETEISRKRSLMRLNTQRIYMQMGCTAQAFLSLAASVKWLARLSENVDEEEREAVAPLLEMVKNVLGKAGEFNRKKIAQAVSMEEEVNGAIKKTRKVRLRLAKEHSDKVKKTKEFGILRLGVMSPILPIFGSVDQLGSFGQAILAAGGQRPSSN